MFRTMTLLLGPAFVMPDMYNVNVEEALTFEEAALIAKSFLDHISHSAVLLALRAGSVTRCNRFIWWTAQGR